MSRDNQDDRQLWAAVVAAEQEVARRRATFYQHAQSRTETLAAALAGDAWNRGSALEFLTKLPGDAPALLSQLVEHALSHRWALSAREAIGRGDQTRIRPNLEAIVAARLPHADDDEYRRLAELLAHVEAWNGLHQLVRSALASDDPHTREVGEDFTAWYGPMWLAAPDTGNP